MSFDPNKIRMIDVDVSHFHLDNCVRKEEVSSFTNDFRADMRFNDTEKQIYVKLHLSIGTELKEVERSHDVECWMDVWFNFEVENFSDLITKENQNLSVDPTLQMSLLGIAFSTARGMLIERSRGTIFEDQFLPVVSPASLLKREE